MRCADEMYNWGRPKGESSGTLHKCSMQASLFCLASMEEGHEMPGQNDQGDIGCRGMSVGLQCAFHVANGATESLFSFPPAAFPVHISCLFLTNGPKSLMCPLSFLADLLG